MGSYKVIVFNNLSLLNYLANYFYLVVIEKEEK